jgi:hypothetical protein
MASANRKEILMRWAKVTLTFMYDLDELEKNKWWQIEDGDLIEMAHEDFVTGGGGWEVERFDG